MYVSDRMAQWEKISAELVGSLEAKKSLLFGTCEVEERVKHPSRYFYHQQAQGIYGLQPKHGYSGVFVPGEYCLYSCILSFIPMVYVCTAHKRSYGKIMFSQVSVCPQGVGVSIPACSWAEGVCGRGCGWGVLPLHTLPLKRPLLPAVRILLECILVYNQLSISIPVEILENSFQYSNYTDL